MGTSLEDLRILQSVEVVADGVWHDVMRWDRIAQNTVGEQIIRSTDSIGANISESFGRFHYGEKLKFLYYGRGSLFETKYWINRAIARSLLKKSEGESYYTVTKVIEHLKTEFFLQNSVLYPEKLRLQCIIKYLI